MLVIQVPRISDNQLEIVVIVNAGRDVVVVFYELLNSHIAVTGIPVL